VDNCLELLQALTYADCSSAPIIRLFTQVSHSADNYRSLC